MLPVGPGFYPRIVLGITALFALWLVILDVVSRRRRAEPAPRAATPANYGLVALAFATFTAYTLLLPWLGFRVATFAFLVALPGVCQEPRDESDEIARHGPVIRELTTKAIEKLCQMRAREGQSLFADVDHWDFSHKAPGSPDTLQQSTNVMPDLAMAMKTNPDLRVMLNGGYYDLATPFFAADYEMHHMPIPAALDKNITYTWYPSGHMVYAHEASLKLLHDNVARFIEQTDNVRH